MRIRILISLMCSLLSLAVAADVESNRPLTGGYDVAIIAEPSSSSFESIGHFQYLRKDGKKVVQVGACDLSPAKDQIAYQGASTGCIFVIHVPSGRVLQVTASFPGLIKKFDWEREPGVLWLDIYEKDSLRVEIPKNSQ